MIENYPTHLIIKTLPKIDRKRRYLREAYKFIKREKVSVYLQFNMQIQMN